MSWSFSGIGKPEAIIAKAKTDLAYKCAEPEETIKGKVIEIIESALGAFPATTAVQVEAYGSQTAAADGKASNQLQFKITPLYGFIE